MRLARKCSFFIAVRVFCHLAKHQETAERRSEQVAVAERRDHREIDVAEAERQQIDGDSDKDRGNEQWKKSPPLNMRQSSATMKTTPHSDDGERPP